MSRTYTHISTGRNSRKQSDEYEYSEEYVKSYKHYMNCYYHEENEDEIHIPHYYDVSRTTDDKFEKPRRHKNSKHRASLTREFHNVNVDSMGYWRNPYGEVDGRSHRMKGARKEQSQRRRTRIKRETQRIIDDLEMR